MAITIEIGCRKSESEAIPRLEVYDFTIMKCSVSLATKNLNLLFSAVTDHKVEYLVPVNINKIKIIHNA